MTKIRMDFVPCLLIGGLLLWLVTLAGDKYLENARERYETQTISAGKIGGQATEDTPLVESIAEMKEHDVFYVITKDKDYELYDMHYDNKTWYALKLPSGEVVCVQNNYAGSKKLDDKSRQTPVGRIVSFDIPDELAKKLDKVRGLTFSDRTFYVDMYGEWLKAPNEDRVQSVVAWGGLLLFLTGMIGSHMLGVKIGIFPPVFPKRKKTEE